MALDELELFLSSDISQVKLRRCYFPFNTELPLGLRARQIFPVVNSPSKTQLALINIRAGDLIKSSGLVLFAAPFFSPLGYGCSGTCVHSTELVLGLVYPRAVTQAAFTHQRLSEERKKRTPLVEQMPGAAHSSTALNFYAACK